ncbi:coenzyme Q-binding protein COQ10 homolog B, mitochondrial-like [Phalacrocorax aristotelis]|uniref:coenzyme Q-binding protein COQ10 homolog B, mitochondrial-like n=1 Tax=Phalacrocorax aristotelis TaxID=126867 RepID=UPI003F4BE6CB
MRGAGVGAVPALSPPPRLPPAAGPHPPRAPGAAGDTHGQGPIRGRQGRPVGGGAERPVVPSPRRPPPPPLPMSLEAQDRPAPVPAGQSRAMAGRGRTLLGALRATADGGAASRCLGIPRSPPVQPARPFLIPAGTGPSGHRERRVLGYSAEQMYELVANVGEYRLFVPWCSRSAVLSRRGQVLQAELEVGFPPLLERYISEVFLGSRWIRAVSRDCCLFRHLETLWQFGPGLPGRTDTCLLDFSVSFEFRSALHSRLASLFLDEVVKQMVSAFEGRAQALFGPQAAARPCPRQRAAHRA